MHVVLLEPEIPQNTGNIARTCLLTNSTLHLIHPLGFKTDEKSLLRSGLDYWYKVKINYYDNFKHFLEKNNNPKIFIVETNSKNAYTSVSYNENTFFMFGKETKGVPKYILNNYEDTSIYIPMVKGSRSLNLSNAVAIVLYEALRQNNFKNFHM